VKNNDNAITEFLVMGHMMMNHEVRLYWILTNAGYIGNRFLTTVVMGYNAMWSAEVNWYSSEMLA
jgi:hypothetical protein